MWSLHCFPPYRDRNKNVFHKLFVFVGGSIPDLLSLHFRGSFAVAWDFSRKFNYDSYTPNEMEGCVKTYIFDAERYWEDFPKIETLERFAPSLGQNYLGSGPILSTITPG